MAEYESKTLRIEDAAKLLGIGRATAFRLVKGNAFPTPVIKAGKRLLVPKAALYELLGLDEDG